MKKFFKKLIILLLVFIFGVTGTALLLNSETTDNRSDMNDAAFPEVMIDLGGVLANRMYGYAIPMQADFTRDSLTPLDTTKQLTFVIDPYDTEVKSLSYEIRTSDGSKVIENRKIKSLSKQEENLKTTVEINSDLRMNQEYSLQISLETRVGTVYYYTRLISRSNLNAEKYVRFVKNFYEKCMDKSEAEELAAYLESDNSNTSVNFTKVNIKSSFNAITWGSLNPKIYRKGIPVIKDINETTASVSMEYQISAKDEDDKKEVYDVTEFYRMRYSEPRTMLLEFERSAEQVFQSGTIHVSEDGLILGVRNKEVDYVMNDTAGAVAFTQEGDLWSYSPKDGKAVRVFSFRKQSKGDFRDSRLQHDIKIIRMEDNGDIDFVVYGYMNRGPREGNSGVCVYHYSSDQNVIEERVFIPSTESYEFLAEDLKTLSYISTDNRLYLLFAQKLYQIHIEDGTSTVLEEGIQKENFIASESNASAAWEIREGKDAGNIRFMDFETVQTRVLEQTEGQTILPLGFMNEDLIYGIVIDGDVLTDDHGHEEIGIHTLKIEGFDGTLKKEYHQEKLYITNVVLGNSMMEFQLSKKSGGSYVSRKKDSIINNKKNGETHVSIELVSGKRTGTRVRLAFEDSADIETASVVYAKLKSTENRQVSLDTQEPLATIYYVYAKGGLYATYTEPAKAIQEADDQMGVVLNRAQQYVWERGNKRAKLTLNLEDVPEAMSTGSLKIQALQEQLGDQGEILDLSGCTLDQVLYEISAQRPVIAKTGKKTSVVIVGYDEYNTYLYDPEKGEIYPYGMNDSTELFEKAGNIFISYVETGYDSGSDS